MEHSRVAIGHIIPAIGDALVSNRRRPMLTLVEDTSGGIHDTLFAACDRWRYEMLGCTVYHDNCTDNLAGALAALGLEAPETPAPLNLFMNIPVIDGNRVEIRIRDNGTGIPPEVKEKMFNPFFTTKPAGEGTGLGLSMSHDIVVKQHGGRIDVETEPGSFTEFIITLPRALAAQANNKSKNTGGQS